MKKDEVFWKNKLDKFSYSILREAGTEMPFSGKYNMFFEEGYYKCKGCGNKLFDSKSKFNSCLLYTSPSPRDATLSRMPSSA